jgi:hypothetical protein
MNNRNIYILPNGTIIECETGHDQCAERMGADEEKLLEAGAVKIVSLHGLRYFFPNVFPIAYTRKKTLTPEQVKVIHVYHAIFGQTHGVEHLLAIA